MFLDEKERNKNQIFNVMKKSNPQRKVKYFVYATLFLYSSKQTCQF